MNNQELIRKIEHLKDILSKAQKTLKETYIPTYAVVEYIKEMTNINVEKVRDIENKEEC